MKLKLKILILTVFATAMLVAAIPSGYYDSASGLTGTSLRQELHNIIDNHTVKSYDYLWTAFATTDIRSSLGSDYIWCMYTEQEFHHDEDQSSGTDVYDTYNREHSWPKSWANETSPHYTDLFHIYPTQAYSNSNRSNLPYGEVALGQATYTSANGTKKGPARSGLGYTGTVFEPIDEYKGDFARTYFYISTRYYGEDGSWDDVEMADGCELKEWAVNMLIEWHEDDPVSTKETIRNDAVYVIQGNRNPFIDHPEYVDSIWGSSTASIDAPVAQSATSITSDGFTANWNSVSGATGYKLYVSTASNFSSYITNYGPKDVGNTTSETLSSLSSGTDYYYRVRAYDSSLESANSNEISLTTAEALSVPTVQAATSVSSSGFTANWSSVSGATGYNLYVSEYADFGSYVSGYDPKDVGNTTSDELSGLSASTDYFYRVSAYNATETSGNSGTQSVTTSAGSGGEEPISDLSPGDIAFTGVNMDNPDQISIVFLVDIADGTEIKFSDNGWYSSNSWRTGEGIHTWTASGVQSAGTEIVINLSGPLLSGSGDQVIAYQNDSDMIAAINNEGDHIWQNDATSSNTSALPQGLTNGVNCVALVETDNIQYDRSVTSGTKEELLAAINDYNNWSGNNSTPLTLSTAGFTVQSNDEPLPISLTDFQAEYKNGSVIISWQTESENENAYFLLFKNDELLVQIEAAGNSSGTRNYDYTDAKVVPGKTYTYYLKDVSYSGEIVSHELDAVQLSVPSDIILPGYAYAVYPNPFNPTTTLPITLTSSNRVKISLHDIKGRKINQIFNDRLSAGDHSINIDMSKYSSAVYILKIEMGDYVQIQKLALSK